MVFLIVNDVGRRIERNRAALAHHDHPPPFTGGANGGGACVGVGGAIDRALHTVSAGELANLVHVVGTGSQNRVAETQALAISRRSLRRRCQ